MQNVCFLMTRLISLMNQNADKDRILKIRIPEKVTRRTRMSVRVSNKCSIKTNEVKFSRSGVVDMIDTFDRPPAAKANAKYASAGSYANGLENKPGKRIPKAGLYAGAGIGKASAEVSIFKAEAKGPNAEAGLSASATGVKAKATAGLGTASASAGPVEAKVGFMLDTGAAAGLDGIEAKFLGCGFSIGGTTSVSLFGNELSFNLF